MTIYEIMQIEQDFESKRVNFIERVRSAINDTSLEGVVVQAPNIAIVSLGTIKNHDLIMSADYYIPNAQATAVCDKLARAKTFTDLLKFMNEMIEKKCIKVHSGKYGFNYPLNEKTISVIKNIDISF